MLDDVVKHSENPIPVSFWKAPTSTFILTNYERHVYKWELPLPKIGMSSPSIALNIVKHCQTLLACLSRRYSQLRTAMRNLHQVVNIPDTVTKTKHVIAEGKLFMVNQILLLNCF